MNFETKNLQAGIGAIGIAFIGWSGLAAAQQRSTSVAEQVLACRTIEKPDERLACFDREIGVLKTALDSHDVVMLDAKEVQRSRRAMFGLNDPDQKILSQNVKQAEAAFAPLTSIIKSSSPAGYGHYVMVIEGGAAWRNIDLLDAAPPPGSRVHIEKTPFGGYLLKIPNFQSVHAARVR